MDCMRDRVTLCPENRQINRDRLLIVDAFVALVDDQGLAAIASTSTSHSGLTSCDT